MDGRERELRVAKIGEEPLHPAKPELLGPRREPLHPRDVVHVRAPGSAESVELAPVALELLTLGFDDVGGCARDEALVGEHRLAAADLLSQPLALGLGGAPDPSRPLARA